MGGRPIHLSVNGRVTPIMPPRAGARTLFSFFVAADVHVCRGRRGEPASGGAANEEGARQRLALSPFADTPLEGSPLRSQQVCCRVAYASPDRGKRLARRRLPWARGRVQFLLAARPDAPTRPLAPAGVP